MHEFVCVSAQGSNVDCICMNVCYISSVCE